MSGIERTKAYRVILWQQKASKCIYRVKGVPGDLYASQESVCAHKKRIGNKCRIVICPLVKSDYEESKEQIKSIW